jgi:hypothetical protein
MNVKFDVSAACIWSAVTCHRFGCFGDPSPKQRRVQRREEMSVVHLALDGDRSPAKSATRSALQSRSAGFQTCCIADFQIGTASEVVRSAGFGTLDTADSEIGATGCSRHRIDFDE